MKVTGGIHELRPDIRRPLVESVTMGLNEWGFVPPDRFDSRYDMARFAVHIRLRWGNVDVSYYLNPDNLEGKFRHTTVEAVMMEMAADSRVPIAEEL